MEIKSVFILAGGKGTRLKEFTNQIPKPMVNVVGKPILIHLINYYKHFGVENIYILTGYKHEVIVKFFKLNYKEVKKNKFVLGDNCNVNILFTGLNALTATRLKKGINSINDEVFYLTYGDALTDLDLNVLKRNYFSDRSIAIVTAVRPPARFGSLNIKDNFVKSFGEKKQTDAGWINGGFFILNRDICKYFSEKNEPFEGVPLEKLSTNNELKAYKHNGFWQCVDTIREREILEKSILNGELKLYE